MQTPKKELKIEDAIAQFRFKWWQNARAFKLAGPAHEWLMKKSTCETSNVQRKSHVFLCRKISPQRHQCNKLHVTAQAYVPLNS